ncbi:N-acetylmuramoyl-L-alanine amidase [Streptomyces sp. NPDC007901]|uniref:peptidoglycan recognition protein family protein n=1 Tax=Streptomyces sp. NPDC007901 TaxID=3364785 RepID=UPI0036E16C5B
MATPLTADAWLSVLKAEGVHVAEYPGWRTHSRDAATGKTFGPVHGVLIHHTVATNSLASVAKDGRPDLPAPLAHTHLAKTGVATMCSAGRANHAGLAAANVVAALTAETALPKQDKSSTVDGNDCMYGLEIENLDNGKDPYPADQYDAAVRWAAAICRHHGWSAALVAGHKETSVEGKVDPSFDMGKFRADVAERLKHPASWSPGDGTDDSKENDVALTAADVKLLASQDGVFTAPKDAADYSDDPKDPGHYWSLNTHVVGLTTKVRGLEESVAALTTLVQQLVDASPNKP